jgi:hypothetical protein
MHAAVSQEVLHSVDPWLGIGTRQEMEESCEVRRKGGAHFFLPSVFTCIGVPLRDGVRKVWEVGLTVSVDL